MPVLTDPLGWFTLQVPDGWWSATEDCVTTLQSPDRRGIVFISGGRNANGPRAGFGGEEFLVRFLAHLGIRTEAAIASAQGVGCRVYSYTREAAGRRWRYWSVTDDETALLISYTFEVPDGESDAPAVEEMVRSIRLYHSSPH